MFQAASEPRVAVLERISREVKGVMYVLDDRKIRQKDRDALTETALEHLEEFSNRIRNDGVHPSVAASGWDSDFKKLGGSDIQYEIRLNGKERATFTIIGNEVKLIQVGGHT